MATSSKLDWKNEGKQVDTANLSAPLAKAYGAYKALSVKTSEARKDFEAAFIGAAREAKMLTPEQTFAFGYKFGRMTVVVTELDKPKTVKAGGFKL